MQWVHMGIHYLAFYGLILQLKVVSAMILEIWTKKNIF